ncbi:MAG: NADH-quinone oxidoreductase subunit N [Planctomycetes bacterium]|nr:NADH-quinone oxidoreductase subunit N [Planctomycetota bacterium]
MDILAESNFWANVDVTKHLFVFSPMIALTVTMLAIVACPLVVGRSARTIGTVAMFGVLVALILAIRVASSVSGGGLSGLSTQPAAALLLVDNLSVYFQIVLLFFLVGVMFLWWIGVSSKEQNAPEFFILLLGSALGMALMVSTANLLMIAIAIEVASLPSYAMVGFDKSDRLGAEASLKYMIFGGVCAAIMLYGISLLYGLVGSLAVADVAAYTVSQFIGGENVLLLVVALLCFFVGIAFKISAVPLHFWCPDAFQGARIEVTTWLSVASKAAGLVLLVRLVIIFSASVTSPFAISVVEPLAWALGIVAALTCTFGNFAAYGQQSVKRLLAYSSIAHAGYMMMAAAVFIHPSVNGSEAGLSALLAYIVIYVFMNLGAFGVTALVVWDTGSDDISAFSGLGRRAPWLAVPMVICLMSLVGLPPFAGFIGKWWILLALGSLNSTLGWFLVIVAGVNTLISLYYYLRLVVQMMLRDDGKPVVRSSMGGLALVNGCALMLILLFGLAHPLKTTTDRFSREVFQPETTISLDDSSLASARSDSVDR